jgi:hypothetical protein
MSSAFDVSGMYSHCAKQLHIISQLLYSEMLSISVVSKVGMEYSLTKRIAKHGRQAIIVIPKILEKQLKPGTIVRMTLDVLGDEDE